MDEHTLQPLNPPQLPERPIRYGVADMFATLMLFGVQLGVAKAYLIDGGHPASLTERTSAAAAICAAFAFGAGYLSFRIATNRNVSTLAWRMALLIACDVLLLGIAAAIYGICMNIGLVSLSLFCFLLCTAPIYIFDPLRLRGSRGS
jgi:hypothetical protein